LKLDNIPRKDLVDLIEKSSAMAISRINPSIVALPFMSSNQDHEATFKAGFAACRVRPGKLSPSMVLSYEQPDISWSPLHFRPNFYVDISGILGLKLEALSLYKSQLRDEPHQRSLENVKRLAELRGKDIGTGAAESFFLHRFSL
jgi:N-acetylglucosamine malate deacetylase 1